MRMALIFAAATSVLLAGCGSKPADCSSEEAKTLVGKLFGDLMTQAAQQQMPFAPQVTEKIASGIKAVATDIRTSGMDEKTKKYQCEANLEVSLTPESEALLKDSAIANALQATLQATKIEGGKLKGAISYTVQETDDGKSVYVEISGVEELAQVAASIQATMAAKNAMQAAQAPAPQAQPASPAESAPAAQDSSASDAQCPGVDISTTVGQLECLGTKYAAADAKLNSEYKRLMGALPEDKKGALKAEQRKWVSEKESKCAEAGKEFEGGTMEEVARQDCAVQMTVERVSYLEAYK